MYTINRIIIVFLPVVLFLIGCARTDDDVIEATGTIEAVEIRIASKVGAHIVHITIDEGSPVHEGDTLVVLDRSTHDIQLRQAIAGVDLAQAQLDLMKKGAREEDIRSAEEGVRQAEAHMTTAREDFRRIQNLYGTNSVSRKQLDDAEARFTVAQAQYNSAQQHLEKLRSFSRPEEIRAQQARLTQAHASAELLSKNIDDSYIVSPVSGIVTNKLVERGELARPGMSVAVVAKLDTVRLMIYLSTVDVGRVRLGQEVDVFVDAYPDRPFDGRITYISPSAEFTPRNIQTKDERVKQVFGVRVGIPNPDGVLKPGLPADAVIRGETPEHET
jgi:HlyD family secretion protein